MNSAGLTVQNRFLRKLHKILTLPVKDLHNEAEERNLNVLQVTNDRLKRR